MFRIACDNHVSLKVIEELETYGYKVVFRAWDETDWNWCNQAIDLNANVFISCDWDIEFFCNQKNIACIRLPQGKGGNAQRNYIVGQLKRLKRKMKNEQSRIA